MSGGAVFPPLTVFYDGADYWLADGFHRHEAAIRAGFTSIAVDIRQGTLQDAQWYSYSVNQSHGLRRTNEDKRRAVEAALRHEYATKYSTREIAQHCGVSHMTIQRYREDNNCNNVTDSRVVTRNGNTYEMNTSNIGSRPAASPVRVEANLVIVDEVEDGDEHNESFPSIHPQYVDSPLLPLPSPRAQQMAVITASSETNEWDTPEYVIDLARKVLGRIDLDPASCAESNSHRRNAPMPNL